MNRLRNVARIMSLAVGLHIGAGAVAGSASAQTFPSEDFHFIVGFPPGSGADVLTRFFAAKLQIASGRTVIVENRTGAAGNIATEAVARAKPDGHTLLLGAGSAIAAGMYLFKNPTVDVTKAFQIAATLNRQAFMLTVDAKSPHKSVAELTAAMKAKGDKASYATTAATGIVLGEMYKSITGVQAVEVRYRGAAEALPELAAGRLDYGSFDPACTLAQARAGRLRILAQSSAQPLKALEGIPTMEAAGVPGIDLTSWWAIHAPIATPRANIDKLNVWFKQILSEPETAKFLADVGGDVFISTPDDAQALFIREEKAWKEYVRIAKIDPQ
jgi:tripartite-type tricarboxylate transporter receptor subunit TctC